MRKERNEYINISQYLLHDFKLHEIEHQHTILQERLQTKQYPLTAMEVLQFISGEGTKRPEKG